MKSEHELKKEINFKKQTLKNYLLKDSDRREDYLKFIKKKVYYSSHQNKIHKSIKEQFNSNSMNIVKAQLLQYRNQIVLNESKTTKTTIKEHYGQRYINRAILNKERIEKGTVNIGRNNYSIANGVKFNVINKSEDRYLKNHLSSKHYNTFSEEKLKTVNPVLSKGIKIHKSIKEQFNSNSMNIVKARLLQYRNQTVLNESKTTKTTIREHYGQRYINRAILNKERIEKGTVNIGGNNYSIANGIKFNVIKKREDDYLKNYLSSKHYNMFPNEKLKIMNPVLSKGIQTVKNNFSSSDDIGSQTVATTIGLGQVSIKAYYGTYYINKKLLNQTVKTAKGTINIAEKVYYISNAARLNCVGATLNIYKNMATAHIKTAIKYSKFLYDSKNVISKFKKTGLYISFGYSVIKTIPLKTLKVAKTIPSIRYAKLKDFKKIGKTTFKLVGRKTMKVTKDIARSSIKPIPFTKGVARSLVTVTNLAKGLSQGDDLGSQMISTTASGINYTYQITNQVKKFGVNATKKIYKAANGTTTFGTRAIKNGLKNTTKAYIKAFKRNVKRDIKKVFKKFIQNMITNPVLIGALVFILIASSTVISSGAGVTSLFGGVVNDKSTNSEITEYDWLYTKIYDEREKLIDKITEIYEEYCEEYHIVRLYNMFDVNEIELNETNILNSLYSVNEYIDLIEPVFHTLALSEYELELTEEEMEIIFYDIWENINIISDEEMPTEFCSVPDGCGISHANISNCPNCISDTHSSYECSSCCYYYYVCNGHVGIHDASCYEIIDEVSTLICTSSHTSYHSNFNCINSTRYSNCNGYNRCNGHTVLAITISCEGFNELLDYYFLDEIALLELKLYKTDEEINRLKDLKENYEICKAYVEFIEDSSNSGIVVNLDGVTLNEVTEFACQFVGNKYVYGGTDINNGIDCSAFVRYVYAHFGVGLPRTSREQVLVGTTISDINYASVGDLIFFSSNGTDGGVYHVAIYMGNGLIVHASNSKPYPQGGIKVSTLGTHYKIQRIAY